MLFFVGVEEESHRWYEAVGAESASSDNLGNALFFSFRASPTFWKVPQYMVYVELLMPNYALTALLPSVTTESGFTIRFIRDGTYLLNTGYGSITFYDVWLRQPTDHNLYYNVEISGENIRLTHYYEIDQPLMLPPTSALF
jgi:hypothetical protein